MLKLQHLPPEHTSYDSDEDLNLFKDDILTTIKEQGNDISIIPQIRLVRDEIDNISSEDTLQSPPSTSSDIFIQSYSSTNPLFVDSHGIIRKIQNNTFMFSIHHDSGANRSVTNNLSLLYDIRDITPYTMQGANETAGHLTCTKQGKLDLQFSDTSYITVSVYYTPDIDGTILSPTEICLSPINPFHKWHKTCDITTGSGTLTFYSKNASTPAVIDLYMDNGLWFSKQSFRSTRVQSPETAFVKTLTAEATYELWHQRLGHPGQKVMNTIHNCTHGPPSLSDKQNSFHKCISCEESKITKKNRNKTSRTVLTSRGQKFHIDFGFVRSLDDSKDKVSKNKHNFTTSIDGFNSYVIIVDAFTRYTWTFLTSSKEPPIDLLKSFLNDHGLQQGNRTIRTDQGGELYRSVRFREIAELAGYKVEPTGSDDSAQNGKAERPNRTFGDMMRCVLHNSKLSSKFWSFALRHCVHLKNRMPHSAHQFLKTPFEAYTGRIPDLSSLKIFGCPVTVKKPGRRATKLANHSYRGIFLEFVNTSDNIRYYDTKTKRIKIGSHVIFDEGHFTSNDPPPGALALRRAGMAKTMKETSLKAECHDIKVPYRMLSDKAIAPIISTSGSVGADLCSTLSYTINPGELVKIPTDIAIECPHGTYARVAPRSGITIKQNVDVMAGVIDNDFRGNITVVLHNFGSTSQQIQPGQKIAQLIFERICYPTFDKTSTLSTTQRNEKGFGSTDSSITTNSSGDPSSITVPCTTTAIVPYVRALYDKSPILELCNSSNGPTIKVDIRVKGKHPTLGLMLDNTKTVDQLFLRHCEKGNPAARIPRWRSTLRNSILHKVNSTIVTTKQQVIDSISAARTNKVKQIQLTFITPSKIAIHPQRGTPTLYLDQIDFITDTLNTMQTSSDILLYDDDMLHDDVFSDIDSSPAQLFPAIPTNPTIRNISGKKKQKKLTRRYLKTTPEWNLWKNAERTQLDLYSNQNMFGKPIPKPSNSNILHLLWVYKHKDDGTYKARGVCNGAPNQRGSVTKDHTFAACLEQPGARIFWGIAATQDLIVLGADASNAFAEAPAPKAPLYVWIDDQYREWYLEKYNVKIPPGHVLPVQHALQGHPESPRLWSRLIDGVIRNHVKLKPTVHEPCLYSGIVDNEKVYLMRQVDDFAIACKNPVVANKVIQMISEKLSVPMHHLGVLKRFNGVDIDQTTDYIKISSSTYLNKILQDYTWTTEEKQCHTHPVPMRDDSTYLRQLDTDLGPNITTNPKEYHALEKEMKFKYRKAIGELLFAMVTTRPDISFPVIKLSKFSNNPGKIHYTAVKNIFRYLRATVSDGIYFWRKNTLQSTHLNDSVRPTLFHLSNPEMIQTYKDMYGFADADWGSDQSNRKSVSGIAIIFAGGLVYYKTKYQPTVSHSTTEAEFTAACDAAKAILYLRSILDQLGVPQDQATVLFEDNAGALLMATAQQPTRRTRHMEIKHFALQEWIEQDLLSLLRVDTSSNISDGFTKQLGRSNFHKHRDSLMGRRPPTYYAGKYSL